MKKDADTTNLMMPKQQSGYNSTKKYFCENRP